MPLRPLGPAIPIAMLILIAMGATAMHLSGIAPLRIVPNFAAWAVGGVACYGLGYIQSTPRRDQTLAMALILLLSATFVDVGQEGVHRWLRVGPIYANFAAIILPPIIVLIARMEARWAIGAALVVTAILIAQPDASQMTGFALAAAIIAVSEHTKFGILAAIFLTLAVAVTWMQPDPLLGVPEVEGIFALGFKASTFLGVAMLLCLAAFCCLPYSLTRTGSMAATGGALSVYLAGISLSTLFGEFPVPFIGLGMSFPIGLLLAIGVMRQNDRTEN